MLELKTCEKVLNILGLSENESSGHMVNLDAKEVMQWTKILQGKQGFQVRNNSIHESSIGPGEDEIIHINE